MSPGDVETANVTFQRPSVQAHVPYAPGELTIEGTRYLFEPPVTARAQIVCFLCNAEFNGKWREDGTPVYSNGVLQVRVKHPYCDPRKYRAIVRCRCVAGEQHSNLRKATDRETKIHTTRNRWIRRAARRRMPATGIERIVATWEERWRERWMLSFRARMIEENDEGTAMQAAYVEVGDLMDHPGTFENVGRVGMGSGEQR